MDQITMDTPLIQITKMEGVRDLPSPAKGKFALALALKAEASGDTAKAENLLEEAVQSLK